tara:strand:+ start:429 stop:845 length:417 start_codon:yes stop_codon:yes gene_type:complete
MKKIVIISVLLFSSQIFAKDNLIGKKFLCSKLLWGFEFISSDKVRKISTNINNKTTIKEYYYEIDIKLPYINLYLNPKKSEDIAFSIHRTTLRVDVWTMTSGGNTTREIIPPGFCQEVDIINITKYIEDLKKISLEKK